MLGPFAHCILPVQHANMRGPCPQGFRLKFRLNFHFFFFSLELHASFLIPLDVVTFIVAVIVAVFF